MRTDYNLIGAYSVDKDREYRNEVSMFPTELEINQRRKDLQREAENYRLVQFARERRPSVWQQLRSRLSAAQVRAVELSVNSPVKQQPECVA